MAGKPERPGLIVLARLIAAKALSTQPATPGDFAPASLKVAKWPRESLPLPEPHRV